MPSRQPDLPFGPLFNSGLLSNHWLASRLGLEPEWAELREQCAVTLARLVDLWRTQRTRVDKYGNEQALEHAFIQPVFDILGWKLMYQTHLQGRSPDYALFLDDASLDAALAARRTAPEFWNHPALLADAKAWHVSLDRPARINNQREYPPQQLEWYLDRSHLEYGILTNGRRWRLVPRVHRPQQRRFQTYLEFDLPQLLDAALGRIATEPLLDEFAPFFLLFSPAAFRTVDRRRPLMLRAIEGSSEYSLGVGEGLRQQAFDALRLCIEGFLTLSDNNLDPRRDIQLCRQHSFILLYRLLFIMYAEDRALLPFRVHDTYTKNRSLGRHRDEIAAQLDAHQQGRGPDFSRDSTALWDDLLALFDLIDNGRAAYGVPAYNGGLFDPDEQPFLAERRIADWYLRLTSPAGERWIGTVTS